MELTPRDMATGTPVIELRYSPTRSAVPNKVRAVTRERTGVAPR